MTSLTWDTLLQWKPCADAVKWGRVRYGNTLPPVPTILMDLLGAAHGAWANWLIIRCMTYAQYVAYGVFAAEQVIHLYECRYPNDPRPRRAIAATRQCLVDPSDANKMAAGRAAAAAETAAWAAAETAAWAAAERAAWAAAETAAWAAWAAAETAETAAWAAGRAAAAAWAAGRAAAAAWAETEVGAMTAKAKSAVQTRILQYGLQLLDS